MEGYCHYWDFPRNLETLHKSPIRTAIQKPLQRDVKNGEFQRGSFYQVAGWANKCQIPRAKFKRRSSFPRLMVLVQ